MILDTVLLEEFEATRELVRSAREELSARPTVPTARGGDRMNPIAIVLRDQQANLVRLAKLLTARKLDATASVDDELRALLDA